MFKCHINHTQEDHHLFILSPRLQGFECSPSCSLHGFLVWFRLSCRAVGSWQLQSSITLSQLRNIGTTNQIFFAICVDQMEHLGVATHPDEIMVRWSKDSTRVSWDTPSGSWLASEDRHFWCKVMRIFNFLSIFSYREKDTSSMVRFRYGI